RINDAGNWEIYNPDLPGYEDSGVKATGFSFKGEYNPQTQYERMDVLTYQGSSFVALKTVQGIVPSDDKQNYTMLAKGGKDGKSAYQYAKEGGFEGTEEEFRQYQTDIVLAKEAAEQVANEIIPEFKTFLQGEKQQVTDSAQSAEQSAQRAENAAQTATQAQSTAAAKSEEAAQSAAQAETEANRAKSEADRAAQIAGNLGWFPTPEKLKEKHPTGQDGWIAVVGQTDTVWTWDSDTGAWVDTKGNGVGDYNRLTNQPQINGITLAGNKSLTELGIQAKGEYISQTALNLALGEKANKDLSDIENSVFLEKGKAAGLLDKESAGNTYSTKEEVKTELGSLSNDLNNHMEQTFAKKEETVNKIVTMTIPPERWTDSGEGIYKAEISEFVFKANEKLNLAPNDDSTISQLIADGVAALVAKNESNTQLTGGAAVLAYQNKPSKAIGLQIEIIKTTEG
ncbi:MAG: hypothetical protein Q4A76_06350, partial [Porphyromonadaceae bacterium]|nr:hypothetical protein [Porphyromonadaceae bacterium]